MLLQIQSSKNKFLVFVNESINPNVTKTVKTIDIYIKNDEIIESESINNLIYLSYLIKKKKLPKFWSFKNQKFVYQTGVFTFDKQKFIKELEMLASEVEGSQNVDHIVDHILTYSNRQAGLGNFE
jgi:mannose-1-phosphate guanylyltransferase